MMNRGGSIRGNDYEENGENYLLCVEVCKQF